MFDTTIRPYSVSDFDILESWRRAYTKGSLELPHGYVAPALETVVGVSVDKRVLGSLTGTLVLSLDPLIRNPASGRAESLAVLHALTRHLECNAMAGGAKESFIAVPADETDYARLVTRCGFVETAQACRIFRHVF